MHLSSYLLTVYGDVLGDQSIPQLTVSKTRHASLFALSISIPTSTSMSQGMPNEICPQQPVDPTRYALLLTSRPGRPDDIVDGKDDKSRGRESKVRKLQSLECRRKRSKC